MRLRPWLIVVLAPILGACEVIYKPVIINDSVRGGQYAPYPGAALPPEEQPIAYPVAETETYHQVFWYGQHCLQTTFHIRMNDGTSRVRYSTPHSCSWRPHRQSHAPVSTRTPSTARERGHPIS